MLQKKGFIAGEYLAWILIGLAVLFIGALSYMILTGKISSGIDYLRNIFKFGR